MEQNKNKNKKRYSPSKPSHNCLLSNEIISLKKKKGVKKRDNKYETRSVEQTNNSLHY